MWHQSCLFGQMIVLNIRISNVTFLVYRSARLFLNSIHMCNHASTDPQIKEINQIEPRSNHGLQCGNDQCICLNVSLKSMFIMHVFSNMLLKLFSIARIYQCIKHFPKVEPMLPCMEYYCRITISGCRRCSVSRLIETSTDGIIII